MLPEERFRAKVEEAARELGISTFYLGFKDPDSDQVKRVFRGDHVWLCGCLDCSITEIKYMIHQASQYIPPPRSR